VSVFEQASWLVAVALVIPLADTWSVWAGPTRKIVTEAPAVFDAYSVALPFPATRVVILRWDEVPGAAGYEVVAQRKGGPRRSFDLEEQRSFALGVSTRHPYTFAVIALGTPSGARLSCQTGCEDVAVIRSTPSLGVEARTRLGYDRLGLTDVVFFALFLAGAAMFRLRAGWTWVGLWLGVALTGVFGYLDPFGIGGVPALPLISLGFLLPNADLLWSGLRRRGD
jgi:hypothetical protein